MRAINDYFHEISKEVKLSNNNGFNLFERINIIDGDLENFKKDKLIFFDTLYNDVYDDPYIIKLVEVLRRWKKCRIFNGFRRWYSNSNLIGAAKQFREQVEIILKKTFLIMVKYLKMQLKFTLWKVQ